MNKLDAVNACEREEQINKLMSENEQMLEALKCIVAWWDRSEEKPILGDCYGIALARKILLEREEI